MTAECLRQSWEQWQGEFAAFMEDLDAREIPYLSHSKVATVWRCPRCYLRQYIEGEEPSSTALTTGLLFHEAAAAFYEAMRAGQPVTAPGVASRLRPQHPEPAEQPYLDSALSSLVQNAWTDHEVVAVEERFFMNLAPDLPPVIGIIDLVLRQGASYVVVDHKTCKKLIDPDHWQLELYAEYVRRSRSATECTGAFDEYRLVPNLQRVRTPVFRRTMIAVGPSTVPALVERYQRAWKRILRIQRERKAEVGDECWYCKASSRW